MQVNAWDDMHRAAMQVLRPRAVSNMVEAGGVAAAVESLSGRIYVGVCVDTACTLGVCAERNALFNMITNGEDAFRRVIAVGRDGKAVAPCGACRELMAQLMPDGYGQVEIMMDYERARIVMLGELTPQWWI
ncbi:cytidine deaminase [Bifidobacterium callitrichos]|uniref:Cytidine deaminase n=1 Tax=Bifidobacterium callitrichos TaxID=762209 RepID=A0A2T3GAL6_9BIFI|nr:cytidine deaminase [Bifidobacterium callitrichos]PST46535.1 cytidine deaminase [Bifidobacterium callitrichos]